MTIEGLETVRGLLESADHFAIVATTRPDGSVHASLVKAGILDDPSSGRPAIGLVVVHGASKKLSHIERAGLATVAVQHQARWVAADGPARIYGPRHPIDGMQPDHLRQLLRDVFIAAGGTHDDWDEYDRAMAAQGAAAVMIDPSRISPG